MRHTRMRFVFGLFAGLAIALGVNLLPYWLTYKEYGFDGYEVIGFPFTFRKMGGLSPSYEFHTDLLLADIAIGVAFAIVAACAALHPVVRQWRHGFPVIREGHD